MYFNNKTTIAMQSLTQMLPFCNIYYVFQLIFWLIIVVLFILELMFFYLSEAAALAHVLYSSKQQCTPNDGFIAFFLTTAYVLIQNAEYSIIY